MPTPRDQVDHSSDVADAEELARQRALALELRNMRLQHRLERELEVKRMLDRRAADLLLLEDALANSGVAEPDFVLHPKEAEATASEPAPKRAKTE